MNHHIRFPGIAVTAIILFLAMSGYGAGGAVIEIHVSPTGDDSAPGTAQAPVRTIEAARKLALPHAGKVPVTVIVADGVYYFDRTFTLTNTDSGTEAAPVIYQAEHEGKAVFSGGVELKLAWTPYKNGIFQATTPPSLEIDQLFANGECQHMARYPNYDPTQTTMPYRGCAADAIAPARVAHWADPAGGYIHAMHSASWGGFHYLITGKNEKDELAYVGGWQNNRPSGMHPKARMVENIFEELDAPGEWFHNRKTRTLYFYPPAGVDLAKAKIEGVKLATLIEVRASQAQPLRYVTFDGFVLRHTARTFMLNKEPLLRSDWTIYRGGTILLEGTEHCNFLNCFIDQPGANGIFVNKYNRQLRIAGLHVFGAGASAVAFVGDPGAVRSPEFNYRANHDVSKVDLTPGPKTDNYPMDCVVEDSLLHEVGTVEKQGAGVEISMSRRITVRHCSIYDTSRAGINIGDGCWGGHIIEGCDIFNTVQETGDHGSFNSWGRDRYWQPNKRLGQTVEEVAKNPKLPYLDAMEPMIIRNSRWRCDKGWDIDLDDGATNFRIYNNLLLHGGLKLREGYGRVAFNNIIVNNSLHAHVWFPDSGDVFTNNIVMGAYRTSFMTRATKWGKMLDYNLFTTSGADRLKYIANGCDSNSIVGDPQFADPAHGDFTPRNQALIQKIGCQPFPMDQFGVQKPSLKRIAKTPQMPAVVSQPAPKNEVAAKRVVWLGATLTEPKGEDLTAYGVAFDSGGVGIAEIKKNSPLAGKKGLQEGDLIQSLNGARINSIADLKRAVGNLKGQPMNLIVVRSQSPATVRLHVANPQF